MKKWTIIFLILAAVLVLAGIGPYSGGSAVADLKAELESVYGPEYAGKVTAEGTEDMVFEITPKSFLLTNWNLRNALGLDYKYECRVIFTTHAGEGETSVRTVTYRAVDPMGKDSMTERAQLVTESREEAVEITVISVEEGQ